ncbi:hypothetical protein [Methanolobus psychrotolerans]|uniref:hypothetical protein n=1 Tax=Methanolobus psychrotolerans TaxID=1874706 RepID=UPI0013EB9675|nr:hypothetical protein [Methanolobus psychrotolerans]
MKLAIGLKVMHINIEYKITIVILNDNILNCSDGLACQQNNYVCGTKFRDIQAL